MPVSVTAYCLFSYRISLDMQVILLSLVVVALRWGFVLVPMRCAMMTS